jgi:hypothetical protein
MKHIRTFESLISNEIHDIFDIWNSIKVLGPSEHEYSPDFEKEIENLNDWEKEDFIDDHGSMQIYICGKKDKFGGDWTALGEYIYDELYNVEDIEIGFYTEREADKNLDLYLKSIGLEYEWEKTEEKIPLKKSIKTKYNLDINNLRKILEKNKIKDPQSSNFAYTLRYTLGERYNFIYLWYYKLDNGSYFFTVD